MNEKTFEDGRLQRCLHPKAARETSNLVEIPLLQTVDFDDLLYSTKSILNRERISNRKIVNLLIRNRLIETLPEDKYSPTREGKTLFELLKYYLSL
ncbi:MAG: hypothetical protein GF311_14320 [Candidatus Lokiarchaeota archaeon]|nr:hypothetical protein [Candidatus Lokiarchaeota archaeon]